MKRTLLDDILQVYNTTPCITDEDSCDNCKNMLMCDMIWNLIISMVDFY